MAIYDVLITLGAAARLTRLVTRDTITHPVRRAVLYNRAQRAALRREEPVPAPARPRAAQIRAWLYQLVTCDWCTSVWVAAAVTALAWACGPHPALVAIGSLLSISYVIGWLSDLHRLVVARATPQQ